MIKLRTLGGLDLTDSQGRELRSLLAQPKRLALLTYLVARNRHGARRRDSLVALFWPELDTDHARGALRQSLSFLRRVLGDGVLNGRSAESVGVEPTALECDATAFDQACDDGRPAAALELYRGDFLEGFFVSGISPDLERWIESERARLRGRAARAAAELVAVAERAGDAARAVQAARQAVALDPDDEEALARLVELLDRCGDRAGALSAFETFRRRLQEHYDATPSPETEARIRSIRERAVPFSHAAPAQIAHAGRATMPPLLRATYRPAVVAGVVGLVALAALAALWWRAPAPLPINPELVAVLPFRVRGADSSLRHLGEGMVELLALELTGEGGSRAVPPGALLSAWHRVVPTSMEDVTPQAAGVLARRLGAGRFLDGAIVGTPIHLTITATVVSVEDGRPGLHARVSGPYDSLQILVDRLAAQLLAGEAGAPEPRLAVLTSLPVLRDYLEGRTAFRRGRWEEALRHFGDALRADSTFAPAALGLRSASRWLNSLDVARAERLAWAFRDRLSAFDRAFLVAELGPRYPAPYTAPERIGAWQQVLARYPEAAEAWYRLGDLYFHDGPPMGLEAPLQHARTAFHRALALDSVAGLEGLSHLLELAAQEGDTAALRPLLAVGLAADSSAERVEAYRWIAAFTARDSAALAVFRPRFRELRASTLTKIWALSQQAGFDVADAVRAQATLAARVDPGIDPGDVLTSVYELALNRGRPQEAQRLAEAISPGWSSADRLAVVVLSALYGDGDTAAAAAGLRALGRQVEAPFAAGPKLRHSQFEYVCVVQQWRVAHGDLAGTPAAIAKLRVPDPSAPGWLIMQNAACSAALEAALAVSRGRQETGFLLQRLDSMVQAIPGWKWSFPRHRMVAHLWETQGEWGRALAAIRRRPHGAVRYLAADLREEARLATLAGDTAGAVHAYRHYLALRLDPEPALRPQVEAVRAVLARLDAKPSGRPGRDLALP
jgi:DNA-binding SARP family transcriptional activator